MMDTAPGPPPVVEVATGGWRSGLETWARALPALAELCAAGTFGAGGDSGGGTDFDFGLARIPAGVEALLRGRPE